MARRDTVSSGRAVDEGGEGHSGVRLPRDLPTAVFLRAIVRADWRVVREGRKHTVIERGGITVTVPRHRVLKPGTLRAILEEMDVTVEELGVLLGRE